MVLKHVSPGDPHASAHNEERNEINKVMDTVDNLAVTASTLDYGQEANATISGIAPFKTISIGVPKGMPDSVGAQLVADSQTTAAASQQAVADAQTALAAQFMTQDEGVETLITDPVAGPRTRAALQQREVWISVADYGAVGDDATDNAAAFQATIDAASVNDGTIDVPEGIFRVLSDLTITASNVRFRGRGRGSVVQLRNAGITVDAAASLMQGVEFHEISIERFGTTRLGPSLSLTSAGSATSAVVRFVLSGVRFERNQAGPSLQVSGAWNGNITGSFFRNSETGVQATRSASGTSVNALTFTGCEFQMNTTAVDADNTLGLNLYGCTFQGNANGVLLSRARGTEIGGGYFEGNQNYDIKIMGDPANVSNDGSSQGVSVTGGAFLGFSHSRPAIEATRVQGLTVSSNTFRSYSQPPIKILEDYAGAVTGQAAGNAIAGAAVDLIAYNGASGFANRDGDTTVVTTLDNPRTTITASDDETLTAPVVAGTYTFEAWLPYSTTTNADIKFALGSLSPARITAAVTVDDPAASVRTITAVNVTQQVLGVTGQAVVSMRGSFTVSSGAPTNVAVRWAQYRSSTDAAKILSGAWLKVSRVG